MTSWEVGVIIALSFVPFYLNDIAERIKGKGFGTFVRLVNLAWFAGVLRVAQLIAALNDATIAGLINTFFKVYLVWAFVLAIYFIWTAIFGTPDK